MSSFDPSSPSPSKSRRRIAAWLAFGAVGLATGAVWASGFAQTTPVEGDVALSPALTKSAPADGVSALAATITKGADLEIDWDGRWGSIAAPDTTLFKVDLSAEDPARTYNIAMLLANTSVITGWSSLQLKVELFVSAGADCSAAVYDDATNAELLHFDDQDEGVYWNGADGVVVGDKVYCIGVNQSTGDTFDGTFLRGADDVDPPAGYPTFIATVDRAS